MMNKKALILGAGGQDGRIISELFASSNVHVTCVSSRDSLDNSSRLYKINYSWPLSRKADFLESILFETSFDYIVDFSSYNKPYSQVGWHSSREALDSVLYIPHFILKCLSKCEYKPNTFFCGSAHQYQPSEDCITSITEATISNPRNEYGLYKELLRRACNYYRQMYSLPISFGILFNHDSCYRDSNYLLPRLVAATHKSFISADVSHFISFLGDFKNNFAFDLSDARDICFDIYTILLNNYSEDFILSSGQLTSFHDLCSICIDEAFEYLSGPASILLQLRCLLDAHFLGNSNKSTVAGLRGDNSKVRSIYQRNSRTPREIFSLMLPSFI